MIEIHFEEAYDAKILYEQILHKQKGVYIVELQEKSVMMNQVQEEGFMQELITFILHVKERQWLDEIIQQNFHYSDVEERQQVIHIAQDIAIGKRKIPKHGLEISREVLLRASLQGMLQLPLSFSFSSYKRFRLRTYFAYLHRLIELAIDEYKMEQEYQIFVETLRQQVSGRKARLPCLHIVFHHSFIFYDEKGIRLRQDRLVQYIDESILRQKMYVDTNIIAPLVSISPKMIYLYTPHADHNMVVTIRNVFQERVKLQNVSEFEKLQKEMRKKG